MSPELDAQYQLGLQALKQGRTDAAIDYFRAVASVDFPDQQAAFTHLARLDLPANPRRYIQATVVRDPDGILRVVVRNTSPVSVANLQVDVGVERILSLKVRGPYARSGTLAPGEAVSLRTVLGPFDGKTAGKYDAVVTRAMVAE